MILKNIKLAFRNLLQNRGINSINIIGLAIGIMAVLLIYQYIGFERSYDKYFDNTDRIQRLVFYRYYQTGLDRSVGNNYYIGQLAYEKIPAIENFCRCKREGQFIQANEEIYKEERTLFADSSFFDIFSYNILSGNKARFLREPNEVIITSSVAIKYFGDQDPVGKTIFLINRSKQPLTVKGVVDDVKPNSHLKFDIVISLATLTDQSYCYACNNTNTYFLIKKGADKKAVEENIKSIALENFRSRNIDLDFPIEFHLQPVIDIHLHSDYRFEHEPNGNSKYLSILLVIAFLIFVSAGMNYFNLYSSIISRRINGIGIRRINGASLRNTISEFITEILLTGLISLVLAFIFLDLFFPFFRNFLNLDFDMASLIQIRMWLLPVLVILILSTISGLILGIRIYGIAPVSFLRKELVFNNKKFTTRFYIVIQFIIAIILITGTIGALKQINYMKRDALTMNIDQTLVVKRPGAREFNQTQVSFQEALLKLPEISGITYSTITPGEKNTWVKGGIALKGKEKMDYQFFQSDVAPGFFNFFSVKLLAGRYFYPDETNWEGGPRHLILNKEAALALGAEKLDDIIGMTIQDYDSDNKPELGEIVGIIDGYFQNSLDQEIKPTIYNCDRYGNTIFLKINNANMQDVVDQVKNEYRKYFKDQYFEYFFLDDYFNSQYKSHIQLFKCFILFSLMAIIITSLSLLGLVIIVSATKTKEIGIRKLNGARIAEVLFMLNREFIMLVAIAYLIAIPIAWYSIYKWLQTFAYRTELSWWIFAFAGIIALGIALLTVSWQSWRAATRNPVEALRYE